MKRKKKKVKQNPDKFDFMKTNKDNIKNLVKDVDTIKKLNDIVINTNK
jgi:hypothetical protein